MFDKTRKINGTEDIGSWVPQRALSTSTIAEHAKGLRAHAAAGCAPSRSQRANPLNPAAPLFWNHMTLTQTPRAIVLASSLFLEVAALANKPTDGVYADCLIALALGHLRDGLAEQVDPAELEICAHAVEECRWLSDAVRTHVPRTLRAASEGKMALRLAADIVQGASNRISHQMQIDRVRASGSDGLALLVETVGAMTEAGRR